MKLNYLIAILTALALGGMFTASPVLANPGDMDTSFNGGAPAVTDPGSGNYLDPFSAAVNPLNGDILFTGDYNPDSGVIEAYKANGTLDTSFGGTGQIIFDPSTVGFPGGSLELNTIAVDVQGRILATGLAVNSGGTSGGMLLMRLNADGSLDTTFNASGYVLTQTYYAEGTGISFTTNGQILVTGDQVNTSGSPDELSVWRFKADGSPDSSFGNSGQEEVPTIADGFYLVCNPALLTDGALLVGCSQDGAQTWTMTRFMSDGTLDTSFGNSGMVTSPAGQYSLGGLALTPAGNIMAAEGNYNSGNPVGKLQRYLADGSVDTSYNGGSPQSIGSIPYFDSEIRIVVQPDEKTLVTLYDGTNALPVIRYLANGGLDNSFGSSGSASVDFSNINGNSFQPVARALMLQADGKVLVSGWAAPSPRTEDISFVTRLDNDTFSLTPAAFSFTDQSGVALNSTITSNMITVSGLSSGVSVPVTVVGGEYRINGGPWTSDPGFTQNGDQIAVRQTSSGSYSTKTTTTLNVGGYAIPNVLTTVLGSPDSADFTSTTKAAPPAAPSPSGGGGGLGPLMLLSLLQLAFMARWLSNRARSNSTHKLEKITMKSRLKLRFLVSTGAALALSLAALPALAASGPGALDPAFNGGVPAVFDLNPSGLIQPFAAAINPLNGDILWAGEYQIPVAQGGAITVYKPDGSLDPAVGSGSGETGLTASQAGFPGGEVYFYALAVDGQGRILAAGYVVNSSGVPSMILARFKPDGSLDTSFGAAGTGIVVVSLNNYAAAAGLSLTADDHILVTGTAADAGLTTVQLTVWRFNPDGTSDTGFGSNGHVQVAAIDSLGVQSCFPALQPDGAIIAGCAQTSAGAWKLVRLKPDGSLDTGFGSNGFITGSSGQSLAGVALAPDGGFVISEMDTSTSPPPLALRRFLADGTVDSGFNGGTPLDFGTLPGPQTALLPIAVQPDGKILVTGNGSGNSLVIARLLTNGTLDSSFGSNGAGIIDFSNINGNTYDPGATALLVQADGRIVASGLAYSSLGSNEAAFVTRVLSDIYALVPVASAFNNVARAPLGQALASNAVTLSGITIGGASNGVNVALTTQNGKYSTAGGSGPFAGAFTGTNVGWVPADSQLALEQMTPATGGTDTTTSVELGGFWAANNYEIPLGAPATAAWKTTTDQPPVASDGTLTDTTGQAASGTLGTTNPSNGMLAFLIVTTPAHGTATITNVTTGAYTYTANGGYTGADSFTWQANDGVADSNLATISVTVKAAVAPPPSGGGGGGGGGGGFGPFAFLDLLFLALVPWWRRLRSFHTT